MRVTRQEQPWRTQNETVLWDLSQEQLGLPLACFPTKVSLFRAGFKNSTNLCSLQATRDLAQYDAAHHEEFKRYEMLKEHERRQYLESLGEEQRKEAEQKLEEQQRRHREHPKVNVPVRTPMGTHTLEAIGLK